MKTNFESEMDANNAALDSAEISIESLAAVVGGLNQTKEEYAAKFGVPVSRVGERIDQTFDSAKRMGPPDFYVNDGYVYGNNGYGPRER